MKKLLLLVVGLFISVNAFASNTSCEVIQGDNCRFIVCTASMGCCNGGISTDVELIPGSCK